jgi:hypothetical protein
MDIGKRRKKKRGNDRKEFLEADSMELDSVL